MFSSAHSSSMIRWSLWNEESIEVLITLWFIWSHWIVRDGALLANMTERKIAKNTRIEHGIITLSQKITQGQWWHLHFLETHFTQSKNIWKETIVLSYSIFNTAHSTHLPKLGKLISKICHNKGPNFLNYQTHPLFGQCPKFNMFLILEASFNRAALNRGW